jgi:catechol 2,3-dioxygenase-like lactoylglutathione lyase family enzyme
LFDVDHIALHVRDLEASRKFYTFLGGRVVSKPSPHFLEIMLGAQRIHLLPQAEGPADGLVNAGIEHFCLQVPSFRELAEVVERLKMCEQIAHHGPPVIEESPMLGDGLDHHSEERPPLKTVYFKDPDGIAIEIRTYKR